MAVMISTMGQRIIDLLGMHNTASPDAILTAFYDEQISQALQSKQNTTIKTTKTN